MKRSWGYALIAALVWASSSGGASAEPPPLLPIQGYLTDSASAPLDGTHQIRFRLYDADTAGTTLFEETLDVNVADGFFTIYLGDTVALDLALFRDNADVYLGIKVGIDAEAEPRLQLGSTAFASLAAFCGDADTVGGLAPEDFQARVVGTCPSGQFMQTIDEDGNVGCMSPPAETDPIVGNLTSGRYCTSNGSSITCDQALPMENDPQVGTLNVGGSCFSNGTLINCTGGTPLFTEVDPKVGTLTNGRWCTTDGSSVNCTSNPPVLTESDPKVGALNAGSWCVSNGAVVNCNQSRPAENDPQVGALTTSSVPRWDGAALSNGRIFDNGAQVGINNVAPNEELDVVGDVEVTGDYRYATPRTFYVSLRSTIFEPISPSDAALWWRSVAGYSYFYDSASAMKVADSLSLDADVELPQGATVTEITCYYYDNTTNGGLGVVPGSFTGFYLNRRAYTATASVEMASATVQTTDLEASASIGTWTDTTIGSAVVDNSTYEYSMRVLWYVSHDQDTSLRFYGCRVGYTLSAIAP